MITEVSFLSEKLRHYSCSSHGLTEDF